MKLLRNILVVDDDPILRARLAAYYVEKHGATVTEAENGIEARTIVQAQAGDFDLVLCDLNMPEEDGIEFLNALGRFGFKGAVAIISGEILATIEMAGILAQNHGLNFVRSLRKPLKTEQLDRLSVDLARLANS